LKPHLFVLINYFIILQILNSYIKSVLKQYFSIKTNKKHQYKTHQQIAIKHFSYLDETNNSSNFSIQVALCVLKTITINTHTMNNIFQQLIVVLLLTLAFSNISISQDTLSYEISCEVHKIYPYLSITKEKLTEAHTLTDLNTHYKPSWVNTYISVEILTSNNGKIRSTMGKNDTLSQEQQSNMHKADTNTDILVKILYLPQNTLSHNDVKEMTFTFTVAPDNDAMYPGRQQQLEQYLQENIMDKIPSSSFRQFNLTAIKFTVNKEGQIVAPYVFETSKEEKIDTLLLNAICNMPDWKPAMYTNGVRVKQDFVLTIGDMESCVVNLLNIRHN
jgi:hypothetical protein